MTQAPYYTFKTLAADDLGLLALWQAQPHVAQWWGAGTTYGADTLRDPKVARWIVAAGHRPFAFMQDYTVHGWPDHHFAALPHGSRGIDQYIGDPEMVGLGHGTGFIAARLKALFEAGAPTIATDPHPDNARAIAVYTKLGFKVFGPPKNTRWGMILPMRVDRPGQGGRA